MTHNELSFPRHLPEALTRAQRPFPVLPSLALPGGSRSAAALQGAVRSWHSRCDSAARAVGDQLDQLTEFSVELEYQDQVLSWQLGAVR
ncbi:hypothetical protein [Corynebacterium occultum]|uniref:hypothetical protein n=1 Tax=Corynebacterium occultum TaxID=2675219 RepID=UPI0012E15453|nr:hypothetical protein [Corynebacterium occultum]